VFSLINELQQRRIIVRLSTEWAIKYKMENSRGPDAAKALTNNPIEGLAFFLENSFARAGGEQAGYGNIAKKALYLMAKNGGYISLMEKTEAANLLWDEFREICHNQGIGENKKLNELVVKGLAKLAQESSDFNPFKELSNKLPSDTIDAFLLLRSIHGIGDKIAAFILRDIVSIQNIEDKIKNEDLILVQPIDRWVNGIAQYIWGYLPDRTPNWLVASKIISQCQKYGCRPTSFNQGAWKYGSSQIVDTNRITAYMAKDPQWK
jgi:hypothetical protein